MNADEPRKLNKHHDALNLFVKKKIERPHYIHTFCSRCVSLDIPIVHRGRGESFDGKPVIALLKSFRVDPMPA